MRYASHGVVCQYGRKPGVRTWIHDRIVEVIKRVQEGRLQAEPANIRLFDALL